MPNTSNAPETNHGRCKPLSRHAAPLTIRKQRERHSVFPNFDMCISVASLRAGLQVYLSQQDIMKSDMLLVDAVRTIKLAGAPTKCPCVCTLSWSPMLFPSVQRISRIVECNTQFLGRTPNRFFDN